MDSKNLLTIPRGQGQTKSAVPSVTVGNYQFRTTVPKGVTLRASFFMHGTSSMVGRVGRYAEPRSVARAGSLFRSLVGSHGSPPVHYQRTDGDYTKPSTESIIMANATTKGAIRPNTPPSEIYEIRLVSEATAIKRLRRHLATIGLQLVITRAGTNQRREWGELAILDNQGVIQSKSVNLECSLKAHGLLADDERIEYRWDRFWLHHIARRVTVQVDGQSCTYHDQVTKDYTTIKAAKKAGETIQYRSDLVLVSWDASRSTKGGTKNGSL